MSETTIAISNLTSQTTALISEVTTQQGQVIASATAQAVIATEKAATATTKA